jgi:hypothetical protein
MENASSPGHLERRLPVSGLERIPLIILIPSLPGVCAVLTAVLRTTFALSVLAIAVGLAIPRILSPVTGALLHELSSIPVIANSAQLIGIKERAE